MGLDMYLEKRRKGSQDEWQEVAYWRKANQIRQWFDKKIGVENFESKLVTKELLEELIQDCKKVLENHELASSVLPTSSGFFFGNTDYDKRYFENLGDTVAMLSRILVTTNWNKEEVAYFEWW